MFKKSRKHAYQVKIGSSFDPFIPLKDTMVDGE